MAALTTESMAALAAEPGTRIARIRVRVGARAKIRVGVETIVEIRADYRLRGGLGRDWWVRVGVIDLLGLGLGLGLGLELDLFLSDRSGD